MSPKKTIITTWKAHKHRTVDYRKKGKRIEYNRIKALEVYRYIRREDEDALIKYIQKNFKPSPTITARYARFILGLHGKLTRFVRKYGQKSVRNVSTKELGKFLIDGIPVYSHKCFAIKYRKNQLIIRVYKLKTLQSNNVKVEIGFYEDKPKNRGPKDNHKKNCEKIAALQEIMNDIDKIFPLFPAEDYTPKSVRIPTIERRSQYYKPQSVKDEEAKERQWERMKNDLDWSKSMETYGEDL